MNQKAKRKYRVLTPFKADQRRGKLWRLAMNPAYLDSLCKEKPFIHNGKRAK